MISHNTELESRVRMKQQVELKNRGRDECGTSWNRVPSLRERTDMEHGLQ